MSIGIIKAFSQQARTDEALAQQLKECQKIREILALAQSHGFSIDEELLYPPNEPQFSAEQLSEKMAKALLRA